MTPDPRWLLPVVVVLAVAYVRARWRAQRWWQEAARWRYLSEHQTRVLRSAWARKCGPDVDQATAERMARIANLEAQLPE